MVGLLFAKTVYTELEVDTEMQHGLLPGALALAAKFVPTMKQAGTQFVMPTPGVMFANCCKENLEVLLLDTEALTRMPHRNAFSMVPSLFIVPFLLFLARQKYVYKETIPQSMQRQA